MKQLSNEICLTYRHISKSFGKIQALSNVSLEIRQGEIFGFIGPDGAGKTTLIRMAMGIVNPDEGTCELLGSENRQETRIHAGYVPQRFGLYPDLSVLENTELFGSLYGASREQTLEVAEQVLTRTGLWPFRDRMAAKLSGGMKQKLALATGLLHTPKILFLDEPTTGVDPVARREFWAMLYELNHAEGLTIVVSTPYMDEAELCTRKMFLSQGRILDCGTTEELISHYQNRVFKLEYNDRKAKEKLISCEGVADANMFGSCYHLAVSNAEAAEKSVRKLFDAADKEFPGIEEITPALEDLFVAFAGEETEKWVG